MIDMQKREGLLSQDKKNRVKPFVEFTQIEKISPKHQRTFCVFSLWITICSPKAIIDCDLQQRKNYITTKEFFLIYVRNENCRKIQRYFAENIKSHIRTRRRE
jgi:hypothetical protein